ncbi:MAG: TolC family protein [Thermodesulfobacteriota bacterium]
MLGDWSSYEPPVFVAAGSGLVSGEAAAPSPDDAFTRQKKSLEEMQASWEQALAQPSPAEAFYRLDPGLLSQLGPAAGDAAAAAARLSGGFSLEALEGLVLLRNPGIAAAGARLRGAIQQYSQVSALDDVLRQYSAFTESLMTGVGPMKGREPIDKRFPFPGVLALKGEVVTQAVTAEREKLEIARRSALTMARKACWSLTFSHQASRIMDRMLGLLRHLEAVAATRYETGKTSFQDVIKVRIRRETAEDELRTIAENTATLRARIRELVDLPPDAAIGAPLLAEPAGWTARPEALYPVALQRRQEIRWLEAGIARMERMIELAETMIYPTDTPGWSFYDDEAVNQVGSAAMQEPFGVTTTASMGAGLPKMPWIGTNDAYLREARQQLAAMKSELRKLKDATLSGVREAWFRLDKARRQRELHRDRIVGLSQAALDVATRGYETGSVGFADVIASYADWLSANLAAERARGDVGAALAELEEMVGLSPLVANNP